MPQKKFTQLDPGTSPTGAEITAHVQGGVSVRSTVLLDTLSDRSTVDTSPATLDFNFSFKQHRIFACPTSFSSPKTISLSNASNALTFKFSFLIASGAALTIPEGFLMDDVRYASGPNIWVPDGEGKFTGEAFYDGTNWFLKISASNFI